LMFSFTRVI